MSSTVTPGCRSLGQLSTVIPAVASSRSRFERGEFQLIDRSPVGERFQLIIASGASLPVVVRRQMHCDWISANAFTLFRGETCHVIRPEWLFTRSCVNPGRVRSGV